MKLRGTFFVKKIKRKIVKEKIKKKSNIAEWSIEMYPLPGILISDVKQDWDNTKVELIDDTGEWFIVPVSILKSAVILRLHGPADVGSAKDIQALPTNLKT